MVYSLLKGYARLAIRIYCPRIIINRPEVLKMQGPLLLAANHPDSFLDGMILTTLFDAPVYSLARGDAFRAPAAGRLLRWLRLLPVYRTSEGVENLGHNYTTFAACRQTFARGGIVLIFSEGRCENEWHLRPLKKGTARLALTSWQQGIPLQVLPTAFNYHSFTKFGKEVHIGFGTPISSSSIDHTATEGRQLLSFNDALNRQLKEMVYEIPPDEPTLFHSHFPAKKTLFSYLLLPFALTGWVLHAPLFYTVRLAANRFRPVGHYDSVLVSLLLLSYPFYLLLIALLTSLLISPFFLLTLLVLPLTALAASYVKLSFHW